MVDIGGAKGEELEKEKRHIYNSHFTVEKLKERVEILERANKRQLQEKQKVRDTFENEQKDLENIIELLQQETKLEKDKNFKLEKSREFKKRENDDDESEFQKELKKLNQDFDEEKTKLLDKIKNLEIEVDKGQQYLQLREKLEQEREELIDQLQTEKKEKMRELADKEREKVQATDKLKKDMKQKINDTKDSLLNLKKEQIATTNKLTVLQNHQLTTELEYQSKQTEKLLFRNSKLQDQISSLKRDVEIHKQVEQELAKRSHTSQKQIKKQSNQIKELEEKNEKIKKFREKQKEPQEIQNFNNKKKDEIIDSLEKHIESIEKKGAKIQNDIEIIKNENFYIQSRLENSESRGTNLAQVLAHNLENFKNNTSGIFDDVTPQDYDFIQDVDINTIRQKDVLDWTYDEKQLVFQVLINKIRSLISKRNLVLNINDPKTLNISIVNEQNKNKEKELLLPRINNNDNNNMENYGQGGSPLLLQNKQNKIKSQLINQNSKQGGGGLTTKFKLN